jgi:hypothetical protein
MKIRIVHFGGTEKLTEFEDITSTGWAQLRYPGGAGCWQFSLHHGAIETKRGVAPEWRLHEEDLETLRTLAKERKVSIRKPRAPMRPRKPRKLAPSKQAVLFE